MKLGSFTGLLGATGTLFLAVCLAQSDDTISQFAALPQCAQSCLATSIAHSSCSLTNQTCLCDDTQLKEELRLCVASNCNIAESLFTKNTTSNLCHVPARNKGTVFTTTSTTLGVISGFFVLLRFGFKLLVAKTSPTADDWLILATTVVGVPNSVINVHGTAANGLGRDVWTLKPDQITAFGRFFFISEVDYFTEVSLLKLSLLFFYLRIFPGRAVRRLLWATIFFDALFGLLFVLVSIFQCHPVDYFWTKWDGEHQGSCLDINKVAWVNAGISITLDLWMLAIPLYQLRHLKLHWKKKVGVGLMFGVGAFVTVVSILRLQSLITFANSTNPTWDNFDVTLWSTIEINVGIICACMPSLRLILVRMFPALMGSSAQTYASGAGPSVGPRSRTTPDHQPRRTTSARRGSRSGIVCTKTYAVERHGTFYEDDGASQLHLRDLDFKSGPTGSSRSEVSV